MFSKSQIKSHMDSLGLSYSKEMDRYLYASMLQTFVVPEPRALRGMRKDPVTGFKWKRKDEFVIEQRYGIVMRDIIEILSEIYNSEAIPVGSEFVGLFHLKEIEFYLYVCNNIITILPGENFN